MFSCVCYHIVIMISVLFVFTVHTCLRMLQPLFVYRYMMTLYALFGKHNHVHDVLYLFFFFIRNKENCYFIIAYFSVYQLIFNLSGVSLLIS